MKTHEIEYDFMPLATVLIDEETAATPIKEMVEFWCSGKERLRQAGGDYVKAWLTQLALHILYNRQPPENGEEGWYPLDGTHGITLKAWSAWEPDEDSISIL